MKGDMTHMNFIKKLLGMEYFVPLVGVKDVADDQYMIHLQVESKDFILIRAQRNQLAFLKVL